MELRAAIALRTLGDKTGPELLRKNLRKLTSSKKTGKHYMTWAKTGEFYLEFGDPKRAATAYERAIKWAMGSSIKTLLWIDLARCHAHRGRHRDVLHAIKESRANLKTLRQAAAKDPALAEMFKHASLKKYLDSFPE